MYGNFPWPQEMSIPTLALVAVLAYRGSLEVDPESLMIPEVLPS
jgi:hypothetical protein